MSSAYEIAINCNHCDNLDDTCGKCTVEMWKAAEAAEARAVETTELLRQAAEVISDLRNERDNARRDRALRADMIDTLWSEYIKAIDRIVELEGTIGKAKEHISQALNEGNGVYRP